MDFKYRLIGAIITGILGLLALCWLAFSKSRKSLSYPKDKERPESSNDDSLDELDEAQIRE